jgi:cardiolipin synthase
MTVHTVDLDAIAGPSAPLPDGFHAQVVGTGPATSRDVTAQLFSRLIFDARRELVISTPYFVPGEIVSQAIMGAARAGVQVTLILPARNDSGFVARASRSYYPGLVEAGVKIVEFHGGLLHSKTLTIDGEITFMGSSNLDIRSFDLNFENDVLLRDKTLTQAVRSRQMEYAAASTPVDPAAVRAWPLARRIWLNVFTVIGPVL